MLEHDDILELENELLTSNNFIKIICSICNCQIAERYIKTLENLSFLTDDEYGYLEVFKRLKDELGSVPKYKTFLYEIGVKDWKDTSYEDKLYTIEELDELFVVLEKTNIKHHISQLAKQFIKQLNDGQFNEAIINDMCNYNNLLSPRTNVIDCYDSLEKIYDNYVDRKPILTGIAELDKNKIDFAKGELSSLMGGTGGFKTTFMVNLAYNKILEGRNVVFLSLEVTKEDMYYDFLSLHSTDKKFHLNIPHSELKRSALSEEEKIVLFNEVYEDFKCYKKHLTIVDEKDIVINSFSKYTQLLSRIDEQFRKETGAGIDIVIVDHIQMLKNNTDLVCNNTHDIISKWVDYFRRNASNFLGTGEKVAIFVVSQVSRKAQEASEKHYGKYSIHAFADSAELERQSSNVFSIKTDSTLFTSEVMFMVHKYRNLEKKDETIHIKITPKYYAFKEIEHNFENDIYQDSNADQFEFDLLYKRKESVNTYANEDYDYPEIEF